MWNSSRELVWKLEHRFFTWPFSSLGANKLSQVHIRQKATSLHPEVSSAEKSERMKVCRLEDPWVTEVVFPNLSISKAVGFCKNRPRSYLFKTHLPSWSVLQSPADEVFHFAWVMCLRRCPPNPYKTYGLATLPAVTSRRQNWERKVVLDSSLERMFYRR